MDKKLIPATHYHQSERTFKRFHIHLLTKAYDEMIFFFLINSSVAQINPREGNDWKGDDLCTLNIY